MIKRAILFALLQLTTILALPQDKIKNFLEPFLSDTALKNTAISLSVANINSGEIVLATPAQLCLIPASILKLVTTATALEMLGPGFRFETKIKSSGSISSKKLKGDLIIEGGGDPTLGSEYFNNGSSPEMLLELWAKTLASSGIDTITGNIVADASIYQANDIPPTWLWEDLGQYYGAVAQGIAYRDNTFTMVFETGETGKPARLIAVQPEIPNLVIQNELNASDDPRDLAYVFGSPYDSFRIIKGTLPKKRPAFEVKSSVPDPALLLAFEFRQALVKTGIVVLGTADKRAHKNELRYDSLLFVHYSPKLSEIIKPLNQFSMNLYAEHLCKQLGNVYKNSGTSQAGTSAIKEFWDKNGLDTRSLFLADGCGLSRFNALTAQNLTDMLIRMKKSPNFEAFYQSIPLAGQEGTMKFYFKNHPLNGNARFKSGSMTRVRSFSGYLATQKGTELAFTILLNNFTCPSQEVVSKVEKLLEEIYLQL
jgi:serine-type D-Ala-D-Ala carboxypeptidase/endopeptidase (penicillin-binding protein 4)